MHNNPTQVMRILKAWGSYTRYLVFSTDPPGSRSNNSSSSNVLAPDDGAGLSRGSGGGIAAAAAAAGIVLPEMWVKRYYVQYGGKPARIRFCVHVDSGLADDDDDDGDDGDDNHQAAEEWAPTPPPVVVAQLPELITKAVQPLTRVRAWAGGVPALSFPFLSFPFLSFF